MPVVSSQLPLPEHVNEMRVLSEISPEKDVDGLHPTNVGDLALRGRNPRFVACTPRVSIVACVAHGVGRHAIDCWPGAQLAARRS